MIVFGDVNFGAPPTVSTGVGAAAFVPSSGNVFGGHFGFGLLFGIGGVDPGDRPETSKKRKRKKPREEEPALVSARERVAEAVMARQLLEEEEDEEILLLSS